MAKKIISASTDTASGLGYFLAKLWTKIKASFYTKEETDKNLANYLPLSGGTVTGNIVLNAEAKIYKYRWETGPAYIYITDNDTTSSTDRKYHTLVLSMKVAMEGSSNYWGQIVFENVSGKPQVISAREFSFAGTPYIGYAKINDYKWIIRLNAGSGLGLVMNDIQLDTKGNWTVEFPNNISDTYSYTEFEFGVVHQKGGLGSSTKPVYYKKFSGSDEGVLSTCDNYAGGTKITLNETDKGASSASFYAPTSVGTKGKILVSNGSGAPAWKNLISPDAIDLYANGSTSAGHGGYIDFHYNASTDDYTSRIIEQNTSLTVCGKLLLQSGDNSLYLGFNSNYTVTSTDNYYFIRSDGSNKITVPAGSGIPNRNLYIVSTVSGSTIVYNGITPGVTAASSITIYMIPNKVYHFISYDANTWYCMNNIDNDSNHKTLTVSASTTLSDLYVTRISIGNGITLTLPGAQAVENRELLVYCGNPGKSSNIRYLVRAGTNTYNTIAIPTFSAIKFIALGGYWYPLSGNDGTE